MKKIYFAASIRGGRRDALLYSRLIGHLAEKNEVLTEHIGSASLESIEKDMSDEDIYFLDIKRLESADVVIAECTTPSLGVGYELCYAEKLGVPSYIFIRPSECHLSAMLSGDPYFHITEYEDYEELEKTVDKILEKI